MGQIRNFSETILRSDLKNFTQQATFSGADFFTLQPGEFERFKIPFECDAPGYYKISVTSAYKYQGNTGTLSFPEFKVLCPKAFTVWNVDSMGPIVGVENYSWSNGRCLPWRAGTRPP